MIPMNVPLVILESFLLNKSDTDGDVDDDDLQAGFHVYKSEKNKNKNKRREKLVWNLLLLLQCIVVELLLLLSKVTTDFLPFPSLSFLSFPWASLPFLPSFLPRRDLNHFDSIPKKGERNQVAREA